MPTITVDSADIHYEVQGEGPPLVLVHGSWADHTNWAPFAGLAAESHRVVSYDRCGHSRSGRPAGPHSRRIDEDVLAGLIEALGPAPAHVVGNSFGGLVALGLAGRRPDLVRGVAVHEPPAFPLATGGELGRLAQEARESFDVVLGELAAGEVERGTRRFVEEIALGPGSWELLPEPMRATFMANAPAFAAEQNDPGALELDVHAVARVADRVLLTRGDHSPAWLELLADRIAELSPGLATATMEGAGHVPHLTHPVEYAEIVTAFLAAREPVGAVAGSR